VISLWLLSGRMDNGLPFLLPRFQCLCQHRGCVLDLQVGQSVVFLPWLHGERSVESRAVLAHWDHWETGMLKKKVSTKAHTTLDPRIELAWDTDWTASMTRRIEAGYTHFLIYIRDMFCHFPFVQHRCCWSEIGSVDYGKTMSVQLILRMRVGWWMVYVVQSIRLRVGGFTYHPHIGYHLQHQKLDTTVAVS
jgi:hypothetical protein